MATTERNGFRSFFLFVKPTARPISLAGITACNIIIIMYYYIILIKRYRAVSRQRQCTLPSNTTNICNHNNNNIKIYDSGSNISFIFK